MESTIQAGSRAMSRDELRTLIRQAARDVAAGRGGRVLVVEGAAGMGKSRMLADALDRARTAGHAIVHGRVGELDRVVPLSALRSACGPLAPDLPSPGSVPEIAERLTAAARDRPLLVALDDVDRCDALTAAALDALVRSLPGLPVLWLLARRGPGPHRAPSLAEPRARVCRLGPLEPAEVRGLAAEVLGARPGEALLAVADEHDGVPELLVERFRSLRRDGWIRTADGRVELDPAGPTSAVPVTVTRPVWDDVPASARRVLEAAAVLGRPFAPGEVAAVLRTGPAELTPALRDALACGLLVRRGHRLRFRSEPVRAELRAQLPPVLRALLHREAAAGLRALGGCETEQIEHLMRGGRTPGTEPGGPLDRVLARCAGSDPARAARLVLRALELIGPDATDRPRLLVLAVRLLVGQGALVRARELATAAPGSGMDPELALALADGAHRQGHLAEAAERVAHGLRTAGGRVRLRLLALRVHVELERGDRAAARRTAGSLSCDDAEADRALAAVAAADGETARALALLRRTPPRPGDGWPDWWFEAPLLLALDRFDQARALLTCVRRSVPAWARAAWHLRVAELRLAQGRTGCAVRAASAGLGVPAQTGAVTVSLHAVLAEVAVLAGRVEEARVHLARADHLVDRGVAAGTRLTWAHGLAGRAERDARTVLREPEVPPGWDALTTAERRVVALVARGLTNRGAAAELHLSPHTVDSHLRRSFAKLGVSNRVALTRLVVGAGAAPGVLT